MTVRSQKLSKAGLPANLITKLSGAAAAANVEVVGTVTDPRMRLLVREAFAWSIRNMWIFYTCIGAIGMIASLFIKKAALSEEHTETKTGLMKYRGREDGIELEAR